jgi:uncharacterized lipoprotein YddW (UPF0748 family)
MKRCNKISVSLFFFISAFIHISSANIMAQPVKEIRGVWVSPSLFGTEEKSAVEKIQSTLDEYKDAGVNTLIIMIKSTSGLVYYNSAIAQRDTSYKWDFFGTFLKEARKREMAVHPWFCVFTEGGLYGEVRKHPEWLIQSRKSEFVNVVNPALPAVREYEMSLILELVKNYDVDWVHLDYIRYPCSPAEVYFSFDSGTRAQFKKYLGEDPLLIKNADSGNMVWNEWIEWNASQVTLFVSDLKNALAGIRKNVKISAAVFPLSSNSKVLIGQDWELWAKEGVVDMLCPMLYTDYNDLFLKYSGTAADIAKNRCLLCNGIGLYTAHNKNTPERVIRQMQISREVKADGVIFFSAGSLTKEIIDAIKSVR